MRRNIMVFFSCALLLAASGSLVFANDVTVTAGLDLQEARLDAASFASDWLTDLDLEDYMDAAVSYKLGADIKASQKELRALRQPMGKLHQRSFVSAHIFAIASDDSECRVRVIYESDFDKGDVRAIVIESVEVLIWPNAPRILSYIIESE